MDERLRSGAVPSADRVPTLTEVLELDGSPTPTWESEPEPESEPESDVEPTPEPDPTPEAIAEPGLEPVLQSAAPQLPDTPDVLQPAAIDEDTLVARVVEALLPSLDALLEARLLEALAPALERAAEQILLDSRAQLAATLHECVQETVAQVWQSMRVGP